MTGAGTPGPKPEASFGTVERIEERVLGDSETWGLAVTKGRTQGRPLRRAKSGWRKSEENEGIWGTLSGEWRLGTSVH